MEEEKVVREEEKGHTAEGKRERKSLKNRIKELEKELEEKKKEVDANYDRFLRLYAEFENYKKRIEKEKEELVKFANEDLIKELLPVIDNLEMALEQAEASDQGALKKGVELTLQQFLSVLRKFGLQQVESLGKAFDPNRHEAVAVEESEEHEEGIVVQEHRKAYFFKNRLLRPALVTVSKGRSGKGTETTSQ